MQIMKWRLVMLSGVVGLLCLLAVGMGGCKRDDSAVSRLTGGANVDTSKDASPDAATADSSTAKDDAEDSSSVKRRRSAAHSLGL